MREKDPVRRGWGGARAFRSKAQRGSLQSGRPPSVLPFKARGSSTGAACCLLGGFLLKRPPRRCHPRSIFFCLTSVSQYDAAGVQKLTQPPPSSNSIERSLGRGPCWAPFNFYAALPTTPQQNISCVPITLPLQPGIDTHFRKHRGPF